MTTLAADERRVLRLSYGYALAVAAVLGYFLMRVPIQVTDSYSNMVALDQSFGSLVRDQIQQAGYLRPGLWVTLKVVYELADGQYFYWFRITHVLQATALLLLFVRLVRPRTAAAAVALPLALAVLVGHQAFAWTVREAFPINTFLTIVLCCLATAVLAFEPYRWWHDVAVAALFVFGSSNAESGLLVWVIAVGGCLVGLRGVSWRGAAGTTALLAAYLVVRFVILGTGTPGLIERDAGYGFERYDGEALVEMFGANPVGFYAYNVVSSVLNVLIAEPRDGVWRVVRGFVRGPHELPFLIGVVSSILTSALLVRFAWTRRAVWRSRRFERGDQLLLLFVMVLGANAAMTFSYTKDVILSPAGVFYAAAVFAAVQQLVSDLSRGDVARGMARHSAAIALLAVVSTTWSVRAVGLHAGLAWTAGKVREQWAYIDDRLAPATLERLSPRARALKQQLQDDAIIRHPIRPAIREQWTRAFEVE